MRIHHPDPEALAKEITWLAYLACGGPSATKDAVWRHVREGATTTSINAPVVMGRPLGLHMLWGNGFLVIPDDAPSFHSQGWCSQYRTWAALANAAAIALRNQSPATQEDAS